MKLLERFRSQQPNRESGQEWIEVSVGEQHLERGHGRNPKRNPLALALHTYLRRRTGTSWKTVSVSEHGAYTVWDFQALGSSWNHSLESRTLFTLLESGQMESARSLIANCGASVRFWRTVSAADMARAARI